MDNNKKIILLAEDEDVLRGALVDRLSEEPNYELLEAVDGYEAVDKIMRHSPDLVLLDIAMPKRDGLAVYRDMRESDWGKDIMVMFLTNSTALDEVASAQDYGPVDYLVKADWDLEDVVEKIRKKFEGQ